VSTQSRRKFVLQAGAVAVAPLIITSLTRAAAKAANKKLGFAICGLGELADTQIAPALQKTEHCRLTGIITDNPTKAQAWQAKYGIAAKNVYSYDTMDKMGGNSDIDVVYVVTPNALHLDHSLKAFASGKHVFCEKPMEITVERCQQMIDAAKAAKRKLSVAYRCQFEANNLECIRIARAKEFGELRLIEASACVPKTESNQWRLKRALSGGGALMDLGIYALQATRYITGEEPVLVSAIETKTNPIKYAEVDETVVWQAKFPSGVLAYCSTSFESVQIARVRAIAERGWFELDPAFDFSGIHGRRSDGKDIALPSGDQFAAEMDDFARCIQNDEPSKVSGEEGLRDVKIVTAIYESIKTGSVVQLS
jgi:predicted dehydrogenase